MRSFRPRADLSVLPRIALSLTAGALLAVFALAGAARGAHRTVAGGWWLLAAVGGTVCAAALQIFLRRARAPVVLSDPLSRIVLPDTDWVEPEGARGAVWAEMRDWLLPSRRKQDTMFNWAILAGAEGSGRTRMATELARAHAANWDAFEVLPDEGTVGAAQFAGLRQWQPERPCLLILDNPTPDAISGCIEVLGKLTVRRPVRLLLVMRDPPEALQLKSFFDMGSIRWESGLAGFSGVFARLDARTVLAPRDIRLMAMTAAPSRMRWRDADVQRFLDATRGNALLVQYGFAWLREGGAPEQLNAATLLQEQLRRLLLALDDHGIGSAAHLQALAVATLAGRPVARGPMMTALGRPHFPESALLAVFGVAEPNRLPPVRPVMVGDVFLRHVARQAGDETMQRIAACAWRVAPQATGLAAARLLPAGDALAMALAADMQAETRMDPVQAALCLIRAAVLVSRFDWDAGGADGKAALARAIACIQELPPARALAALPQVAAVMAMPNALFVARGAAGLACFCATANRALAARGSAWSRPGRQQEVAEALSVAVEHAMRWGVDDASLDNGILETLAALVARLGEQGGVDPWARCWERLCLLFDERGSASPRLSICVLSAMSRAAQPGADRHDDRVAAAIRLSLSAAAFRDPPETLEAAAKVLAAASRSRPLLLEAVRAWRLVAYANARARQLPGCISAVRQVDTLMQPHADERAFQIEHLRALKSLCYLHAVGQEPEKCQDMARIIETLCAATPQDRDFALLHAEAWMYVAEARSRTGDKMGCIEAVTHAERVLRDFGRHDRDIQLAVLRGWTDVAYLHASTGYADGCADAAAKVNSVLQLAFAGEREFEAERVMAWKNLALAQARDGDAPAAAATAEAIATAIRTGFSGQAQFELEQAQAWAAVCFAHAMNGDIRDATAAAERVDAIAGVALRANAGRRQDFERECVSAWRAVAYAGRHDATVYHAAMRRIEAFTRSDLAADPAFRELLTEVLAFGEESPDDHHA